MAAIFENKEQHDEMCVTFATLILQDAGLDISAENIGKLVAASGNEVEPYWGPLFAGLAAEKDIEKMLLTGGGGGGGGGGAPAGSSKPHKYAKKKKTVYAKTALQFYSEAKYKKVALKNADADDAMIHTILRKKFDSLSDQRRIKYTELAREYAARGGSDV
jgi:large subunit ribosomal protein LP1